MFLTCYVAIQYIQLLVIGILRRANSLVSLKWSDVHQIHMNSDLKYYAFYSTGITKGNAVFLLALLTVAVTMTLQRSSAEVHVIIGHVIQMTNRKDSILSMQGMVIG